MSDINIGQIITTDQKRDAIHFPIAPVASIETLYPGQHVGFVLGSGTEVSSTAKPIGIVDPYLKGPVYPGQKFWLLIYPNTVTGMRHEWTHTEFPGPLSVASKDKAASEAWLRNYASRLKPYEDHDAAYASLLSDLERGRMHGHGKDLSNYGDLDDPDLLEEHAEVVTGRRYRLSTMKYSCSC